MPKKKEPEMIPARKLPRYIEVEKVERADFMFRIYISRQQVKKVPGWMQARFISFFDPPTWGKNQHHKNHVYLAINAKDELEAYTRFCRLWRGLPTE